LVHTKVILVGTFLGKVAPKLLPLPLMSNNFKLFCILLIANSCKEKTKTYQGYSKQADFYYKLVSLGDETKKTDSSQCLWISASCKTLSDSIFWDTKHNNNQTFFITKNSSAFLKNIYGFSIGDSLEYLFPTQRFFAAFYNSPVPFFCKNDSCVKFSVKITRALSTNQFKEFNDSLSEYINQQRDKENIQIQDYITKNCKQVNEFASNAFIEKTGVPSGSITTLDSVKKGKKIKLMYKGYFLDGTLVDYTPNNWAFEFVLGQEGQLIDGLQLALYKLKKGEKAKIILPSRLAFGEKGSSNGAVPPYTPLVYQIEIVDIK
jgi:FKBP-type peptidyl-prolyl cis-trans isomerase FkpA